MESCGGWNFPHLLENGFKKLHWNNLLVIDEFPNQASVISMNQAEGRFSRDKANTHTHAHASHTIKRPFFHVDNFKFQSFITHTQKQTQTISELRKQRHCAYDSFSERAFLGFGKVAAVFFMMFDETNTNLWLWHFIVDTQTRLSMKNETNE